MAASIFTKDSLSRSLPALDTGQHNAWQALLECAKPRRRADPLADLSRNSFDWPQLLQFSESHGLVLLLADCLKLSDSSVGPPETRAKLRESQRAFSVLSLQLTAELFRLLDNFRAAGIQALVTKGPALSVRCYGDPGMRQYGDLDLVLRERDIRRATLAMLDLGYEPRVPLRAIDAAKSPGEYAFRKPGAGLLIEFHTERTFRYHPRPLNMEMLFERQATVLIDARKIPALSLEDELVLICVHGAKHFWERLLWIADVAALCTRQPIDWQKAASVAREAGAERILRLGLRLASDLLGAELPAKIKTDIEADRAVARLAAEIEANLALQNPRDLGILQRALFRIRMRGGLFTGPLYLLRLLLSPTEEDWVPGKEGKRSAFVEVLSRPFRLAKKHGRHSNS